MDDRTEAYRALFTRKSIREVLSTFDCEADKSEFVYDCIQLALQSNDKDSVYYNRRLNVNNVVHEVFKRTLLK